MSKACPQIWRVDAHFAGKLSVEDEATMRRHLLEGCDACHFRYTRLAMLAKVQPGAMKPEDRIAAGLGFRGRERRWPILIGVVAAAAVLAIVVFGRKDDQFASRGPAVASGEVRVFRVRAGAAGERVVDRIGVSDELAFAYRNGTGKKYLFVFGVDEHRHVYWFSPAWKSATERPAAPVAVADGAFHEIEDAIGHPYDGSRLDVYGLFTDRPWSVQEIEAVVGRAAGAPSFDDGVLTVQRLEVTR
jgi:hypothetical protein